MALCLTVGHSLRSAMHMREEECGMSWAGICGKEDQNLSWLWWSVISSLVTTKARLVGLSDVEMRPPISQNQSSFMPGGVTHLWFHDLEFRADVGQEHSCSRQSGIARSDF